METDYYCNNTVSICDIESWYCEQVIIISVQSLVIAGLGYAMAQNTPLTFERTLMEGAFDA